jgi:hypothetical protein
VLACTFVLFRSSRSPGGGADSETPAEKFGASEASPRQRGSAGRCGSECKFEIIANSGCRPPSHSIPLLQSTNATMWHVQFFKPKEWPRIQGSYSCIISVEMHLSETSAHSRLHSTHNRVIHMSLVQARCQIPCTRRAGSGKYQVPGVSATRQSGLA